MNITITEALVKLKTLESRIEKAVNKLDVVSSKKADSDVLVNGITLESNFVERAKASYQSVTDLIKLYSSMKSSIAESNAKTLVTIGGVEYTVTEAINKKNSINLDNSLLNQLQFNLANATKSVQALNRDADSKANKNIEIMLGSDKAKNKTEESQLMYDAVYSKNKGVLVDPLEIEELIEKKQLDIKSFLDEVDTKLVISNSTTFIEVEE